MADEVCGNNASIPIQPLRFSLYWLTKSRRDIYLKALLPFFYNWLLSIQLKNNSL